MRADARNLLERLGKQDFAYKEFTDRFSDLELWPVFEALLNDKRLFSGANDLALPAELVDQRRKQQREERACVDPDSHRHEGDRDDDPAVKQPLAHAAKTSEK